MSGDTKAACSVVKALPGINYIRTPNIFLRSGSLNRNGMLETCNLLGCEACETGTRVFSGELGGWFTTLATAAETAAEAAAAAACAAATCCAACCATAAAAAWCAAAATTLTGVLSSLFSHSLSWKFEINLIYKK